MSTTQIRRQIMILLDSVSLHLLLSPCGDQNANSFTLFSTPNANQCLITLFRWISFTFSIDCVRIFVIFIHVCSVTSCLFCSVYFTTPFPSKYHACSLMVGAVSMQQNAFAVFEYSLMCTLSAAFAIISCQFNV
eukprot:576977_1